MTTNHRLQLLSPAEIQSLYGRPCFDSIDEQSAFFMLNATEEKLLLQYNTVKTKLYFLLQLGYFKATQQFYAFRFEEVADDVRYLVRLHFQESKTQITGKISENNIHKQRQSIMDAHQYKYWNNTTKTQAEERLLQLVRTHPRYQDSFRELLAFLNIQKVIIPSYRSFQEIFSKAITQERHRLTELMSSFLSKNMQKSLDSILERNDGISQLSLLKSDQKNFQLTATRKEIEKLEHIKELYKYSKQLIPQLQLSKNCILHYCELVEKYTIHRLKAFNKHYARLYILCYVYSRCEQISDYLIITFQYHVNKLIQDADEYATKQERTYYNANSLHLPKVSKLLRWMVDDSIQKTLPYSTVLQEAFSILPQDQFINMANFIDSKAFDRESVLWRFYGMSSRKIAIYLRSIFLVLEFSHINPESALMQTITLLKEHYKAQKSPAQFDPSHVLKQLVPKNKITNLYCSKDHKVTIDPARFEFFVYSK